MKCKIIKDKYKLKNIKTFIKEKQWEKILSYVWKNCITYFLKKTLNF